jgi:methylmalonyl-CoA/ethylmalonyl-CoA epimerase
MLPNFKFHHIGFVTNSIEKTAALYSIGGYSISEIISDAIQNVNICFLTKQGAPRIELVEPLDEFSSVNKILKKSGVSPYHICYEVDDIFVAYDALCELGYIPLFRPVEAIAIENKLICYFFKKEIGYIELLNCSN